jgi:hypothetical protein
MFKFAPNIEHKPALKEKQKKGKKHCQSAKLFINVYNKTKLREQVVYFAIAINVHHRSQSQP